MFDEFLKEGGSSCTLPGDCLLRLTLPAVVVEQVFNWPGMGRMAWQAAQDRDYPLIMGITLVAAIIVRMGSLMQRVVHIIVNPRASKE